MISDRSAKLLLKSCSSSAVAVAVTATNTNSTTKYAGVTSLWIRPRSRKICATMNPWPWLVLVVAIVLSVIQTSRSDGGAHTQTVTSRKGKDFEHGVGGDGPPSARAGHGMDAWDMYVGEVYLFGGCVNMSNNYTSSFGSLALWHGCTGFSNEVWKMYSDEHSGQISWWRLWSQPNTTRDSYMHRDPFNGESAAYASARAGCSVIGFDSPDSAATTLFVFGGVGLQDGPTTADTWLFDTAQGAWTAVNVSTPPPPRAYHSTVHWKDLMIIFGGLQVTFDVHHYTMYTFAGDVAVFNTTSRRWYTFDDANPSPQWNQEGIMVGHPQALHQSNDAPVPRAYHAASLHSSFANTMFVYGGAAGTGHYYQDWFFDDLWTLEWDSAEALLSGKMTWTRLTPSSETVRPPPLFGQTLMWCNGSELAMMWGMMPNKSAPANATATQTLWRINLNTMTWRKPTGLYQKARAFFATVSVGCGGWLSAGLAGFGGQSELLSDFSEAGALP